VYLFEAGNYLYVEPYIHPFAMNKRDAIKQIIKKLVLQEITMNTNTVGTTDTLPDQDAEAALKKALPKDDSVQKRPGSSKVTASGKHQVALSRNSDDSYDVVSITNGSDRRTAKNLKLEEVNDFIKKHASESEKSYVQKAFDKTSQGHGLKKDEKVEKKEEKSESSDKMDDAEETKQADIADDNTVKADEKADKKVAPVDDDLAPQMGGELVDKIEKVIDRVLKNKAKADAKTAHLKPDSEMESPDKLSVKMKETPALKEKKS